MPLDPKKVIQVERPPLTAELFPRPKIVDIRSSGGAPGIYAETAKRTEITLNPAQCYSDYLLTTARAKPFFVSKFSTTAFKRVQAMVSVQGMYYVADKRLNIPQAPVPQSSNWIISFRWYSDVAGIPFSKNSLSEVPEGTDFYDCSWDANYSKTGLRGAIRPMLGGGVLELWIVNMFLKTNPRDDPRYTNTIKLIIISSVSKFPS
jgi:hypothetical protein